MTHQGTKLFDQPRILKASHSVKGTIPRDARFFDKTQQEMQFCGPADYNITKSDTFNSKIQGNKCNTIFARKAINRDAREHSNEYIMIGNNIKHAPAYRNHPSYKKSLRKKAHENNRLQDSVKITDILLANMDQLEELD